MSYNLFLDDLRTPRDDSFIVARDVPEAIAVVRQHGVPSVISFDHDLGEDENGRIKQSAPKFLWFLIDQHLDGHLNLNEVQRVVVHSHNPTGARNIADLWNGFAASELDSGVTAEVNPF